MELFCFGLMFGIIIGGGFIGICYAMDEKSSIRDGSLRTHCHSMSECRSCDVGDNDWK